MSNSEERNGPVRVWLGEEEQGLLWSAARRSHNRAGEGYKQF
jgi:hypothetical protein